MVCPTVSLFFYYCIPLCHYNICVSTIVQLMYSLFMQPDRKYSWHFLCSAPNKMSSRLLVTVFHLVCVL